MVHALDEGQRIVDAQKRTGRICQVGSQRVSSIVYQQGEGAARRRRDRRAEPGRGLVGPQLRDRRLAVHDPARRLARDRRLGPLPGQRAAPALRADAAVPLAQLLRLRHRRGGRSVRPPVLGPALRHRRDRARRASWPPAACATGRTAATPPTCCSGSSSTRRPSAHPEFTLSLKVNFADGAGESEGFRFVGPDGVLSIGGTA